MPRKLYLETFGCQMNVLDSELVLGQLRAHGYQSVEDRDAADVILYNTCSVREHAENKVWSRLGELRDRKKLDPSLVIGVIGCMAERDGVNIFQRHPHVDVLCGPGELDKLVGLVHNAVVTNAGEGTGARRHDGTKGDRQVALMGANVRRSSTLAAAEDNLELLDLSRSISAEDDVAQAYVRITRGCNKFCTYCVVPHTRGAEVHRPPDHIVEECRRLADQGVIEITLLGQTVNHYVYVHGAALTMDGREAAQIGPGLGYFRTGSTRPTSRSEPSPTGRGQGEGAPDDGAPFESTLTPGPSPRGRGEKVTTFADLLYRIHEEVPAIKRLRFVTSYPRDFSDEALQVMRDCPRICRYLHAPAQSGSDRILKLMNRGYTVGEYLEFVERARAIVPEASIAGDIIVGFPTETDADFELTKDLLRRVRYKNQFIFKYSPRPGTAAIRRFPDDVPDAVKKRRNNELLALQSEISASVHRGMIGTVFDVMIESVSRHESTRGEKVELRWENHGRRTRMIGRTAGDLIVSFDIPDRLSADDLIGTIRPVEITGSGPLILFGSVCESAATVAT